MRGSNFSNNFNFYCLNSSINLSFVYTLIFTLYIILYKSVAMNPRKEKFEHALQIYLDQVKPNPEIVGIIASGSFAHGQLDKHSDIDVYMILAPGHSYRERGNTWIEGVEIEYFYNPPEQIRAYFRQEGDKPHTAHIFTHGRVEVNRDPVVDTLIQEAEAIMGKKAQEMSLVQRELAKYWLDDHRKDYWDCLDNGDELSARIIGGEIIDQCITYHFRLRRQFPVKAKRLLNFLQKDDPEFGRILRAAIEGNCKTLNEKSLLVLISHLETRLGGARGREWVLRSELDLR